MKVRKRVALLICIIAVMLMVSGCIITPGSSSKTTSYTVEYEDGSALVITAVENDYEYYLDTTDFEETGAIYIYYSEDDYEEYESDGDYTSVVRMEMYNYDDENYEQVMEYVDEVVELGTDGDGYEYEIVKGSTDSDSLTLAITELDETSTYMYFEKLENDYNAVLGMTYVENSSTFNAFIEDLSFKVTEQ